MERLPVVIFLQERGGGGEYTFVFEGTEAETIIQAAEGAPADRTLDNCQGEYYALMLGGSLGSFDSNHKTRHDRRAAVIQIALDYFA